MSFISDPEMKEIVDSFCNESLSLVSQMENILDMVDDQKVSGPLESYGQIVDRIMGAAKSIDATEIGKYCELCKIIGYKAGQSNDDKLVDVVIAVLLDATDLLRIMVERIQSGKINYTDNLDTATFATRLRWLSEKFKNIERASVAYQKDKKAILGQSDIDTLLKDLGL